MNASRSRELARIATLTMLAVSIVGCRKADNETVTSDTARGVIDSAPATTAKSVAVLLTNENVLALLDTTYDIMLETDLLAQSKASAPAVKQFADRAVSQAALSRRAVQQVIERTSIAPVLPDDDPLEDHAARIAQLRASSGSSFDRAYVAHALEVRAELLDEVNDAIDDADRVPALRTLLEQVKAQLEAERDELERIKP